MTNHGVGLALQANVLAAAEGLFALPAEEKNNLNAAHSPLWRGYISQAAGLHTCAPAAGSAPDQKESFTVGAPCGAAADANAAPASPMHGPNQWPAAASLPGFEAAVQVDLARVVARGGGGGVVTDRKGK